MRCIDCDTRLSLASDQYHWVLDELGYPNKVLCCWCFDDRTDRLFIDSDSSNNTIDSD